MSWKDRAVRVQDEPSWRDRSVKVATDQTAVGASQAEAAALPAYLPAPVAPVRVAPPPLVPVSSASLESPSSVSPLRRVAQVITTPVRGLRGVGVGAEKAISNAIRTGQAPFSLKNVLESGAVDRAAAATKPGFKPQPGEKAGAFLGETAATAALVPTGGGVMAQAAKGALSAGTLTAIMEAADRGDVSPADVVFSSGLGALAPAAVPVIKLTSNMVARAVRGAGRVFAKSGTTLEKSAMDALEKNPKILEMYRGTTDAVNKKVVGIQKALIEQHQKIADHLERVRENIGFREPFMESTKRIEKEGFQPKPVQDIVREFRILKSGTVPVEAIRPAKTVIAKPEERSVSGILTQKQVKRSVPRKATKTEFQIPDKLRLRELYRLREAVDDHLTFPQGGGDGVPRVGRADQHFLRAVRNHINQVIETIPGGKALRAADQAFYLSRQLYDDLQKKLATQGKAEEVIRSIIKGGDVNQILGVKGDALRLLQRLEQKTGKKLIEPAAGELAAKNFRDLEASGWTGLPASIIGPEGTARILRATNRTAKVFGRMSESLPKRPGAAARFIRAAVTGLPRRGAEADDMNAVLLAGE